MKTNIIVNITSPVFIIRNKVNKILKEEGESQLPGESSKNTTAREITTLLLVIS